MEHFATCPRGLEEVLVAELVMLGARDAEAVDGGAAFAGDFAPAIGSTSKAASPAECCGRSATPPITASRISTMQRGSCRPALFDVNRSIRVDTAAIRSPVKSLDFVTLRVKDAVCDAFRAGQRGASGRRYTVTRSPDPRFPDARRGDVLSRYFRRPALQARVARRDGRRAAKGESGGRYREPYRMGTWNAAR